MGCCFQDFELGLEGSRHSGSAAETAGVGLVWVELIGSWPVETELVALVHQQQLEQRLFWGVEVSQFQQELGLPVVSHSRRAQAGVMGQRRHRCWLR